MSVFELDRRSGRIIVATALVVLAEWLMSSILVQAQTTQHSFVTRSFRGADVLRVTSEVEVPPSRAFGTVRVTIANPKRASVADRSFMVVFYVKPWDGGMEGFSYTVPVKLAEGQKQVAVEIPYVEAGSQSAWDVALFEEGRELEDKRQRPRNQLSWQWSQSTAQGSSIASLQGSGEKLPALSADIDALHSLASARVKAANVNTGVQQNLPTSVGKIVSIKDATDDWRTFYPYWIWCVSVETVQECNAAYPEVAKALRQYVAAGGTLLVQNAQDIEDLTQVEQLLGSAGAQIEIVNWESMASPQADWRSIGGKSSKPSPEKLSIDGPLWSLVKEQEMLRRGYLSGAVLITRQSIRDMDSDSLSQALSSVENHAINRTAISADGNWFWRNLISAVGKPPVWSFAVMVALFGALLGPGLLYFTGRIGRRSLMIFFVPLISLIATSAIIAYSVLHEGFETHIRVTSVSRIDAGSTTGFAWSRQNYFSGSPPRRGLSIQRHTFARPVYAEYEDRWYGDPRDSVSCRVTITDHQQWRGWLKPRQQQQLLLGHSIDKPSLPVTLQGLDGGQLKVSNQTQHELPLVIVRGGGDDYYYVQALGAGQSSTVSSMGKDEAGVKVARDMAEFRLLPPADMQDGGSLLDFGSSRSWRRRASYDSNDVISLAINRYLSDSLIMRPFSYATILPQNDLIEVPLEGTHAEGMHIVIGDQVW